MVSALLRSALLALFFLAAPAQAQLYKWVDSNGRVQYSDRKPPDARQKTQEVRGAVSSIGSQSAAAGTAAGGQGGTDREKEFQKRRQEQAEADKKHQQSALEQKQKSENCSAAQRNLAALQSGQRIARFDEKGERSYLDDSGRAQEIERTRQLVEANCK